MFQELGKQGVPVFILPNGSPGGGVLSRCNLIGLALWIAVNLTWCFVLVLDFD